VVAVAAASATDIEEATHNLAASRRWLAPLAWAAGAIVMLVHGVKLLVLNWRLSLIELVPAAWVWFLMWDLKQHTLRGAPFRHITTGGLVLLILFAIVATTASFWCNAVFAFAITDPPPRIARAAGQVRPHLAALVRAGIIIGVITAAGALTIPRTDSFVLYVLALGAVLASVLISFVAVPARIIGVRKRKLPARETIGRAAVGGTLSAVAMAPGFVLDRLGLILLGIDSLRLLGFVVLSLGTALYAAGMSSVRAVKLSMKLDPDQQPRRASKNHLAP